MSITKLASSCRDLWSCKEEDYIIFIKDSDLRIVYRTGLITLFINSAYWGRGVRGGREAGQNHQHDTKKISCFFQMKHDNDFSWFDCMQILQQSTFCLFSVVFLRLLLVVRP